MITNKEDPNVSTSLRRWSIHAALATLAVVCFALTARAEEVTNAAVNQSESENSSSGRIHEAPGEVDEEDWTFHVALGAQFLPDYDETGRSSGLSEQQFFAQLLADRRFGADCDGARSVRMCAVGPWHMGVNLSLLGTPVKREDRPAFSPHEFNDVAQSIVSSLYFYSPMVQQADNKGRLVHNFGPIARVSAISRESIAGNGDSVTWLYSLGAQYTHEAYRKAGRLNGIPSGFLRVSAARFEDYAGFGRSTRLVTEGALRVVDSLHLYVGFQGNFGSGPDEMALVITFTRTPDQLASLFSGLLGDKKQ